MGPINAQLTAIANSSHRKYIRPDLTIKTPGILKRILWVIAGPFHGLRKAWFGVDYRSTAQNLARYQANVLVDPALWNPTIKKLQRMNRAFRHLKPITPLRNPGIQLDRVVLPRTGAAPLMGVRNNGLGSPVFSGALVLPPVSSKPPHYTAPRPSSVPVVQVNSGQRTGLMTQGERSTVGTRDTAVADYSGQGGDRLTNTNSTSKRVGDRQKTHTAAPATRTVAPSPSRTVPVVNSSKPTVIHQANSAVSRTSASSSRPSGAAQVRASKGSRDTTLFTGRSTGGSSLILKKK